VIKEECLTQGIPFSTNGGIMGDMESFGNSSGPHMEKALEKVAELVQELYPGSMTQKFVLIIETIDEEDRSLYCLTAPHQKAWDTMGLLSFSMSVEESS
jgi:hypothetical protein